ncbi:MAG: hypothetical protein FD156_1131 [Nitrospirae bacterium]|nr:MAG: hypothetical protein FD156_1131 [Nitrospirota bacterium]
MSEHVRLNKLRESKSKLYEMHGFAPRIINQPYLEELKVGVRPSKETLHELQKGSSDFVNKYENRSLVAELSCLLEDIPLDEPLKTHRYTSRCPIDVLEVNPMSGCNVNCLYCLVVDGDHSAPKKLYKNYASYLRRKLTEDNGADHCYYFAPQTEPFQESTLQTGTAHDILREFIAYFKQKPKSKSKVFVLSKAGKEELQYKNNGDTILDLMRKLSGNLVYHTSISVMPPELYPVLEPRAASIENRLEAAVLCQENKIEADWAVVQPAIPAFLTDKTIDDLLRKFKEANLKGFKPEMLTLSIKNLAWIGQLTGYIDKSMEKKLYELYTAPENKNNVKHKNRVAPNREFTHKAMMKLKEHADKLGLDMTICSWVRSELNITPKEVPVVMRKNLIGNRPAEIGVCKPAIGLHRTKRI